MTQCLILQAGPTHSWFNVSLHPLSMWYPSLFHIRTCLSKRISFMQRGKLQKRWGVTDTLSTRTFDFIVVCVLSCVMERVCSKISEHPLLGTCLGTLQMFWNNQHAKASTEILPPSPEQKERGRCRDDWPVYQHHSDSLWAKSQCFGIVCIKSMYNSGISCCCTQENALQKWSTGWWQ